MKYQFRDEGTTEDFEADSREEALEGLRDFAECYRPAKHEPTAFVSLYMRDEDDDFERIKLALDPPEPKCTAEHEWKQSFRLFGGCKENPGVQGHGGGVTIKEYCPHCGAGRYTDTWAQDPEDGEQGLQLICYEPPGTYEPPA